MPTCLAYGCSNASGRSGGKRFFMVPKPSNETEKSRASKWLHNMGTGFTIQSFSFGRDKTLCADHFHEACFKEDLQAKLMGYKPKKLLLPGAIPTIFKHKTFNQINIDSSTVVKRARSKRQHDSERSEVLSLFVLFFFS